MIKKTNTLKPLLFNCRNDAITLKFILRSQKIPTHNLYTQTRQMDLSCTPESVSECMTFKWIRRSLLTVLA